MWVEIGPIVLRIFTVIGLFLLGVAYLVWAERKLAGYLQERYGPNRVGPFGLLQPIADLIKLLFKEDITPAGADRTLYLAAPVIAATMDMILIAIIPFAPGWVIADVPVALLYFLAVGAFAVYGVLLGGWASNSKYALLGGLRTAAQLISYEVPMALAVVGVVLQAGTLSTVKIVEAQKDLWFIVPQFLAFLIFLVSAFAETNRLPFDLPEAESELVAGFHTEYSSLRFALFFMGEYAAVIGLSALGATLFLGGWHGSSLLPPILWFLLKTGLLVFLFIWVRWTFPRFRFDQLMALSWKVLIPLGFLNLALTAVAKIWL